MMPFLPSLFSKANLKRFAAYLVAFGILLAALANIHPYVRAVTGLETRWQISLAALGVVALFGLFEFLARWLQKRRSHWTIGGDPEPGYFQLTPRTTTPQGQTCFREDRADERTLGWMQIFARRDSRARSGTGLPESVVLTVRH